MRKIYAIFLTLLLIVLAALNVYQYYRYNTLEENSPIQISELKGENQESYIGRTVTVEGYFANIANKYPILITNTDYLLMDREFPDDQFLVLIIGKYENATGIGGAFVQVKGKVLEIEGEIGIEAAEIKQVVPTLKSFEELLEPVMVPFQQVRVQSHKYAVLISGGIKPEMAHSRYWNDMKYMYQILNNTYGYDPDNIFVIYKDGIAEDNGMPVDFSATITNVNTVFTTLANTMTSTDSLFIFMNNHGSGFDPSSYSYNYGGLIDADGDEPENGYSEASYGVDFNLDGDIADIVQIDEALNLYYSSKISDDDLADLIDNIECKQMIIFMKQCFSGGLIHDLSGSNRIILTACGEEEPAWGADTEGDWGEFSYHFMKAVNGEDWTADTNNDNKISMVEAFTYASNKDSRPETPHYDDNGDGIGHAIAIPGGGDGIIGSNAFL